MKRNKSILQVLLGILLCVALAFPGMKATVFAVDRIDETDAAMTENGAIPENEGIKENDPLPGSGELLYEDAAFASTDGDALAEGSESAAAEGSYKESYEEDLLPEGEDPMKKTFSRKEKSPKRMEMEPPVTVFSLKRTIRRKWKTVPPRTMTYRRKQETGPPRPMNLRRKQETVPPRTMTFCRRKETAIPLRMPTYQPKMAHPLR